MRLLPRRPSIVGLTFRCPGLDDEGCPDKQKTTLAVGERARDGLSAAGLYDALKAQGWILGVARLILRDGSEIPGVDPLCANCGEKLLARVHGGVES